jgi:nuclear pore complex protein Nup50
MLIPLLVHQEKFKDVVNWLKQNQAGSTVVSSPSPHKDEKTNLPAIFSSPSPHKDEKTNHPATFASPSPNKDEKANLAAADGSKLLVQPSSDNTQKAPVMASSSSTFQSSSSPTSNLFSSPKSQTPDFSGIPTALLTRL